MLPHMRRAYPVIKSVFEVCVQGVNVGGYHGKAYNGYQTTISSDRADDAATDVNYRGNDGK